MGDKIADSKGYREDFPKEIHKDPVPNFESDNLTDYSLEVKTIGELNITKDTAVGEIARKLKAIQIKWNESDEIGYPLKMLLMADRQRKAGSLDSQLDRHQWTEENWKGEKEQYKDTVKKYERQFREEVAKAIKQSVKFQLKPTRLVQRIQEPSENQYESITGIVTEETEQDWDSALDGIWQLEYMGAAEFELGAIPNTLDRIVEYVQDNNVATGEVKLEDGESVSYICDADLQEQVEERIQLLYEHEYGTQEESIPLKEPPYFGDSELESIAYHEEHHNTCGWLEMNNDFMFFSNDEMYRNTLKLLELTGEYEE